MSNYRLYVVKAFIFYLSSPLILAYSSISYLLGRSGDSTPSLKLHLLKLFLRLRCTIASDTNVAKLDIQPPLLKVLQSVTPKELALFEPSSYASVCSVLPSGQQVCWINKHPDLQKHDPVILYFHGGALFRQAVPQHISYMLAIVKKLREKVPGSRVSLAFVDYTLLPRVSFPAPLQDCIDAYDDLTVHQGFKNVIVSGDSAGALLSVTLMAAMKIPPIAGLQPPKSTVEPNGLVILFPWLGTQKSDDSGSYKDSMYSDMLTGSFLRYWANVYCRNDEELFKTLWINPSLGSSELWKKVVKAERTFVSYGSDEILADDAQKWIELADIPKQNIYVDPKGCHASLILDYALASGDDKFKLPSFVKVVSFYKSLISEPDKSN